MVGCRTNLRPWKWRDSLRDAQGLNLRGSTLVPPVSTADFTSSSARPHPVASEMTKSQTIHKLRTAVTQTFHRTAFILGSSKQCIAIHPRRRHVTSVDIFEKIDSQSVYHNAEVSAPFDTIHTSIGVSLYLDPMGLNGSALLWTLDVGIERFPASLALHAVTTRSKSVGSHTRIAVRYINARTTCFAASKVQMHASSGCG